MKEEPDKPFFSGSLFECFEHFRRGFSKKLKTLPARKRVQFRNELAKFCKTPDHNIQRWLQKGVPTAKKENILRLSSALEIFGYSVTELFDMSEHMRNFWNLIAFDVFSLEKATELLGFSEKSTMMKILIDGGTTKEKQGLMLETWRSYREELDKKRREIEILFQKYQTEIIPSSHHQDQPLPAQSEVQSSSNTVGGGMEIGSCEDHANELLIAVVSLTRVFCKTGSLQFFEKKPSLLNSLKASEILEFASMWSHLASLVCREKEGGGQ